MDKLLLNKLQESLKIILDILGDATKKQEQKQTIIIHGGWGDLVVDADSGVVMVEESNYEGGEYRDIVRFDLAENKLYNGELEEEGDILDFGYLAVKGEGQVYEPPVSSWRNGKLIFSR
jgi:hypothetical protein